MIRRRTFWFRLTAWGFGPIGRPLGGVFPGVRAAHEKTVLASRRNTGIWGEWW